MKDSVYWNLWFLSKLPWWDCGLWWLHCHYL